MRNTSYRQEQDTYSGFKTSRTSYSKKSPLKPFKASSPPKRVPNLYSISNNHKARIYGRQSIPSVTESENFPLTARYRNYDQRRSKDPLRERSLDSNKYTYSHRSRNSGKENLRFDSSKKIESRQSGKKNRGREVDMVASYGPVDNFKKM